MKILDIILVILLHNHDRINFANLQLFVGIDLQENNFYQYNQWLFLKIFA